MTAPAATLAMLQVATLRELPEYWLQAPATAPPLVVTAVATATVVAPGHGCVVTYCMAYVHMGFSFTLKDVRAAPHCTVSTPWR
jgi:hypothetical protein